MGTRNLTIVISKSKTKVAQYGQWDGYPTGQGQTIADFLKIVDIKKFTKLVDKLGVYTDKDINDALIEVGANPKDEYITCELAKKRDINHPALSRDYGAEILELINNGTVTKVVLVEDFKDDSLWCEYWYEINLDKKTVRMNEGKPYTFKEWCRKGLMKKLENQDD